MLSQIPCEDILRPYSGQEGPGRMVTNHTVQTRHQGIGFTVLIVGILPTLSQTWISSISWKLESIFSPSVAFWHLISLPHPKTRYLSPSGFFSNHRIILNKIYISNIPKIWSQLHKYVSKPFFFFNYFKKSSPNFVNHFIGWSVKNTSYFPSFRDNHTCVYTISTWHTLVLWTVSP